MDKSHVRYICKPNKWLFVLISLSILLCYSSFAVEAKKYTLFSRGKTDYSIVIDRLATESEQEAATELQKYLKLISGIDFPIQNDGKKGKRIIIGYSDIVKALAPEYNSFDKLDDSFSILNVKGDILIYGGSLRGTLYGVYDFLEKELSCRWYTKEVSFIPPRRKWRFKTITRTVHPSFQIRTVYYRSILDKEWVKHSRNSGQEMYWGYHTMGLLVPADKYFSKHPEYYSLWDGKRRSDAQLCLSNPHLVKVCADTLKKLIRQNPDYLIYDLSQNDNQYPCQCNLCQAIVKEEGSESGPIIRFVNKVADLIKEEFPDKYIGTFAYTYSRTIPKIVRPNDNVVIRLCDGECCFAHGINECEVNKRFFSDLQAWSSISKNLMVWDYVAPVYEYLVPFPNITVLQPNIQLFEKYGAIGVFEQGSYTSWLSDLSDLKTYLLSKLLWDVNADVDALTDDFLKNVYGKAAPYVKQYIDYSNSLIPNGTHLLKYNHYYDKIYSCEMVDYCRDLFSKAESLAESDEIRDRIRVIRIPVDYLFIRNNPEQATSDGTLSSFRQFAKKQKITWGYRRKLMTDLLDDLERGQ